MRGACALLWIALVGILIGDLWRPMPEGRSETPVVRDCPENPLLALAHPTSPWGDVSSRSAASDGGPALLTPAAGLGGAASSRDAAAASRTMPCIRAGCAPRGARAPPAVRS